jgi:cytochrome c553
METIEAQARELSHVKACWSQRSFTKVSVVLERGARVARRSFVISCLLSFHSYGAIGNEAAPDNIETRMRACTPCHGVQGQGTLDDYFPRLAGKPAGYLYNQLTAFRSGRRHYSPMNYLLEYQNDDYLKAIASYFASQKPPFPPRQPGTFSSAVLAHGEALATHGDASRGIPACAACHNPSFTGVEPGIPALVGLQSNYIEGVVPQRSTPISWLAVDTHGHTHCFPWSDTSLA